MTETRTQPEWAGMVYTDHGTTYCAKCDKPMRYSTSYGEPHYVHESIADTMACPQYASTR